MRSSGIEERREEKEKEKENDMMGTDTGTDTPQFGISQLTSSKLGFGLSNH